jgi:hypothetical protein
MSATQVVPSPAAVRTLLAQLVGPDVVVTSVPSVPARQGTSVVAVYVHDDGSPAGVWVSTVAFAASAGAALTGIQPTVVEGQIRSDRLGDMALDNFRELMNVGAALFNVDHAPHTRLLGLYQPPHEPLPPGVADLMKAATAKVAMHVSVERYGEGPTWILMP